jgi:hypothetical protein
LRSLQDSSFEGVGNCLRFAVQIQLYQDVLNMISRRKMADAELWLWLLWKVFRERGLHLNFLSTGEAACPDASRLQLHFHRLLPESPNSRS